MATEIKAIIDPGNGVLLYGTNGDFSSMVFCGIPLRVNPQFVMISNRNNCSDITRTMPLIRGVYLIHSNFKTISAYQYCIWPIH